MCTECPANPGPVPQTGNAVPRLPCNKLPGHELLHCRYCHSNDTQTKEVHGFIFEKRSQPGAPLRNRTVDLLLTMYHCAVPQSQVDRLTCVDTSTRWHSQAPEEPTQAPFATQSATHFDLGDEPPYEVVNIQFDDRTVCVHGLSPRSTSANRLRSARCAVQGWAINARRRRSWTRCTQTEPWGSLWRLMTPVAGVPRRDRVD